MSGESNLVDVDCALLHETEKAYLVEGADGAEVWVPKSNSEWSDGVLTLPEWLAIKKGLV